MTHKSEDPLSPYRDAPGLTNLRAWSRTASFAKVPHDWLVFVADIEQSTRAIQEGRYKAVNAVGAACIVAATNACGRDDIPFVFSGDGACVVIPPVFDEALARAWAGLRSRVWQGVGLRLRVGRVAVSELRERGADLRFARRCLPLGMDVALFAGGALTLADRLVKSGQQDYELAGSEDPATSVESLECRWDNVASRNGRIMTVIVQVRDEDPEALAEVMAPLERMLPAGMPVSLDNLPGIWPPRHLGTEMALRRPKGLRRLLLHAGLWLECGFFELLLRRHRRDPSTAAGRYAADLVANTDYVKLDDVVRAVLDVSAAQAAELEGLLQHLRDAGRIDYGIHYSDHALMTCFVRSLQSHLHFVDGGDGGYSRAAAQLKASGAMMATAGLSGHGARST